MVCLLVLDGESNEWSLYQEPKSLFQSGCIIIFSKHNLYGKSVYYCLLTLTLVRCRFEKTIRKLPVHWHTGLTFSDIYHTAHLEGRAQSASFLGTFLTAFISVIFCTDGCYLVLHSIFWGYLQYYFIGMLPVRKYPLAIFMQKSGGNITIILVNWLPIGNQKDYELWSGQ